MYQLANEIWPQKDPITGREICHACWNVAHKDCGNLFDTNGDIFCDHAKVRTFKNGTREIVKPCLKGCAHECDCVHLSEANFAAIEKQLQASNRREKKKLMREHLESEDNPLRADNPDFRKRYSA